MTNYAKEKVLAGSRVYQAWRLIAGESVTRKAWDGCGEILTATFRGSRIVNFARRRIAPLFLVGDYLEQQYDITPVLFESSLSWTKLIGMLKKVKSAVGWRNWSSILSGSRAANSLVARDASSAATPRRKAMAILLLFILAYYPFRQVLLFFFAGAESYAGWACGIALGLILAANYLYLAQPTDSDVN